MKTGELLEPCDVAKLAGVTPQTIRYDVGRGLLPVAFQTPYGRRLFRREDVNAYLADRQRRLAGRPERRVA